MMQQEFLNIVTQLDETEDASFEARPVTPESYQEGFHWGYKAALKAVKEMIVKE